MSRIARSPIFLMALTIFVDFTGFGLIIPLLPFWAKRLGADPFGVGLVLTIYALAQFLFTPILGALSDRYGRRPVILASLGIEACGFALTALAGSLPALLAARFIGGLGASNLGSAQAVVADVTPPAGRARGMGMIGAAIGLGFVVGPALGGVLAVRGLTAPFWAAMAIALLNAALVARFLPETRRRGSRSVAAAGRGLGALLGGWRRLGERPLVARLVTVNLLFTVAFTAMEAVFPLLTLRRFGWGATQNGYLFTFIGVIVVVMQGGLVGRLVKRWGERRLLLGGLVVLAAGLILLPIVGGLATLLIALGLLAAGEGAVTPTISALLSLSATSETQGEILGVSQGVAGLGRILGPLLGGALFTMLSPGAPFVAGGVLALAAAAIAAFSLLRYIPTPAASAPTRPSSAKVSSSGGSPIERRRVPARPTASRRRAPSPAHHHTRPRQARQVPTSPRS